MSTAIFKDDPLGLRFLPKRYLLESKWRIQRWLSSSILSGLKYIRAFVIAGSLATFLVFPYTQALFGFLAIAPPSKVLLAGHESELKPVVDCVIEINQGFIAYFGYKNGHDQELTIDIGADNYFTPEPIDRTQPTEFLVGHQHYVFLVQFDENNSVTWNLNGKSATASSDSPRCQSATQPSPGSVETPIPSDVTPTQPGPTETLLPPNGTPTEPSPNETPLPPSVTPTEPNPTQTSLPPSITPTESSPTGNVKPTANSTSSPTASLEPTASSTPSPTSSVGPTANSSPSPTVSVEPTANSTLSPTANVEPTTSSTSSPTTSVNPTPNPTSSPTASVEPTASSTPLPTMSVEPTANSSPSSVVSVKPTANSTSSPTANVEPTTSSTSSPIASVEPTRIPTPSTTVEITAAPTNSPDPMSIMLRFLGLLIFMLALPVMLALGIVGWEYIQLGQKRMRSETGLLLKGSILDLDERLKGEQAHLERLEKMTKDCGPDNVSADLIKAVTQKRDSVDAMKRQKRVLEDHLQKEKLC